MLHSQSLVPWLLPYHFSTKKNYTTIFHRIHRFYQSNYVIPLLKVPDTENVLALYFCVYLYMAKTKKDTTPITFNNPFLVGDKKELWKKLEAGSRPISKGEVFKKAQEKKDK